MTGQHSLSDLHTPAGRGGGLARPIQRRYHFHWPGLLYAAVTAAIAVGAIRTQNNLLFLALGLALGGLLVSGIISGLSLMGIRLEWLPAARGRVGEPIPLRYRVGNTSRLLPAFGLTIEELRAPTAGAREDASAAFVLYVAARASLGARAVLVPAARGRLELDAVRVWSTFPFGLAKKSLLFRQRRSVLVAPVRLPLRPASLRDLLGRTPDGLSGSKTEGEGDEPFGVREFLPGDNPARIAWKPSARLDRLILRQHAQPANSRTWIVLQLAPTPDTSADETAIAFAAALITHASSAGTAVGLAVPAAGILHHPRLGARHAEWLIAELAGLDLHRPGLDRGADGTHAAAFRSGECIVVHAGPITRGHAPRAARHVAIDDLDAFLEPGDAADLALAALGRPPLPRRPAPAASARRRVPA